MFSHILDQFIHVLQVGFFLFAVGFFYRCVFKLMMETEIITLITI